MRVLVLPSAHGQGHRARMGVLARALARAGATVDLEPPGLPPRDLGARLWNAREADRLPHELDALRREAPATLRAWEDALRRAAPDLVVVDADPYPLAAARRAGLRALLVSNFTWGDIVEPWSEGLDLAWLDALHEGADALALPFTLPLCGVTGARRAVPNLADAHLGAPDPARPRRLAVYAVGFGNVVLPPALSADEPTDLETVPGVAPPPLVGDLRRVDAPARPAERMPFADLAVVKTSYGAVTEALAARAPMLALPRPGAPEDALMARMLTEAGVARVAWPHEGVARLPDARERARMRAGYGKDLPWMRCDPDAVARAALGFYS